MLQKSIWTAAMLFLLSAPGLTQEAKGPSAQLAAMKQLSFLVGEWKGESWSEFVPGQKNISVGTETVQSKLGGLLLVIDGDHRRKTDKETGAVTHGAFGVLSFDEKTKKYKLQAYTNRGAYTEAEAKVSAKKLEWGFEIPQFGQVRYLITINDKGQWSETGEVSKDGKQWRKFFEMTLDRVKTP